MKLPFVTPDIEQALTHFFRLTFIHNAYPIFLAAAMSMALIAALIRPTRAKILLFLGFGFLLFHFEYLKHILEPLKSQTLTTVTTETPRYAFIWLTDKLITRIIPLGLAISGIGCILATGIISARHYERPRKS